MPKSIHLSKINTDLTAFASKSEYNAPTASLHITQEHVEVTNGIIALRCPVAGHSQEIPDGGAAESTLIPVDIVKAAAKAAGKNNIALSQNGGGPVLTTLSGAKFSVENDSRTFPKLDVVIPERGKEIVALSLNAEYLIALGKYAKAHGTCGTFKTVQFYIQENMPERGCVGSAVRVEIDTADGKVYGALMPCLIK